jgi:hypothetical protein
VESIQVSREDEVTRRVLLNLKDPDKEVSFLVEVMTRRSVF